MVMKLRNQKGAAAVEFAIVLSLLLLLVFGIIEFGLLLYDKAVLTNASREGARFGIVLRTPRYTDAEIQNVVTTYCSNYLITFGGPTTVQVPAPIWTDTDGSLDRNIGDDLEVTVTYAYKFLLIPKFISITDPKTLTAKTLMKYE